MLKKRIGQIAIAVVIAAAPFAVTSFPAVAAGSPAPGLLTKAWRRALFELMAGGLVFIRYLVSGRVGY